MTPEECRMPKQCIDTLAELRATSRETHVAIQRLVKLVDGPAGLLVRVDRLEQDRIDAEAARALLRRTAYGAVATLAVSFLMFVGGLGLTAAAIILNRGGQ